MIEQMIQECVKLPIKLVASHAFFVMNALFGKKGCTSYQAAYGRQPAMLPPTEAHCGKDSDDGRQEQRVRQIEISATTQASAWSQIRRVLLSILSTLAAMAPRRIICHAFMPTTGTISTYLTTANRTICILL